MNILGVHVGHDASIALVKDGRLVTALTSERLSRVKKHRILSAELVDYVLSENGLTIEDIDIVTFADYDQDLVFDTKFKLYVDGELVRKRDQSYFFNDVKKAEASILGKKMDAYILPHHLAHAASAFYTSSFDKSWAFTMDASGGNIRSNSLIAYGEGNKLTAVSCPGLMVGHLYSSACYLSGIGEANFKAGSLMGMASYLPPSESVVKNIKELIAKTIFDLDADYYDYSLVEHELWERLSGTSAVLNAANNLTSVELQAASNVQYLFEEAILHVINSSIEKNGVDNLVLAGGSFLNCNVNSRIKKETRFNNLHLFPGCTDDGNAVGAALYVAHHILDFPRQTYKPQDIAYLGRSYTDKTPDYKRLAKEIANGKIVAWFMGKSEFGPRALCNRSLLADPRQYHTREVINFLIKKREWFRPFAPVVMEEHCSEWFDWEGPSPFMLFTATVKKPELIPAVTHVDNTARMQTVTEDSNLHMYNLLKEYKELTGIPLLLNTSLNGPGEPIVESSQNVMTFFRNNPLVDILVLNGEVFVK
jgi:carbamoyltransferase